MRWAYLGIMLLSVGVCVFAVLSATPYYRRRTHWRRKRRAQAACQRMLGRSSKE